MRKEFNCGQQFEKIFRLYSCEYCPLYLATITLQLMAEKNLTLGDAFKLCLKGSPEALIIRERIRERSRDNKVFKRTKLVHNSSK